MDEAISHEIRKTKRQLKAGSPDLKAAFDRITDRIRREVDAIQSNVASGRPALPETDFKSVAAGTVPETTRNEMRKRGFAIVRGVYPRSRAEAWNDELGRYIEDNDYLAKAEKKRGLDQYFSQLDAAKPQIFGIYWSKPQVMARQGAEIAQVKRFLNRLWDVGGPDGQEFDPDNDYTYADRTRRRRPGDKTLGLSPHMDSGSYERWTDPAFQKIYAPVFAGKWEDYDPWKAAYRTKTKEHPSPAVCSMFRTFQGWTALTPQGPKDGTLQVVPISIGIAYMLLRALQADVPEDDLCGAEPGRALSVKPEWHPELMKGIVSIPLMEPGDTVWWHPDTVHAVENEHAGKGYSNVIYIGASPRCEKNRAYAVRQAKAFLEGRSAPDFAAEDYEVDFRERATIDDLTDIGRAQMAL
ncbi:MAG TPA: YbiU family protein [Aestuariivirgaceae bacterium]|nr:YbiU family protein [Aestuariivirgaceae bacterium]